MADDRSPLLYLVHRIPFPPNKGDKVRSFNILRQLARRHRVFLGTFVDHPDDAAHVGRLAEWCEESHVVRLNPRLARVLSLRGLLGEIYELPIPSRDEMTARINRKLALDKAEVAPVRFMPGGQGPSW